ARVDRQSQHAIDELRILPTRGGPPRFLGELAHGGLGVVDRETIERNITELDAAHVHFAERLQPRGIKARVLLDLYVVGMALVEPPARPIRCQIPECGDALPVIEIELTTTELTSYLEHSPQHG